MPCRGSKRTFVLACSAVPPLLAHGVGGSCARNDGIRGSVARNVARALCEHVGECVQIERLGLEGRMSNPYHAVAGRSGSNRLLLANLALCERDANTLGGRRGGLELGEGLRVWV